MKTSITEFADKIKLLNEEVLSEAPCESSLSETERTEVISAAHYNLGQVYVAQGELENARSAYNSANIHASPAMKPAYASARLSIAKDDDERVAILTEVANIIVGGNVPYSKSRGTLGFDQNDMAELMAVALKVKENEIFQQLLRSACERSATNAFETLVTLAETDFQAAPRYVGTLLRYALTDQVVLREALLKQKLNAATLWMANSIDGERDEPFSVYWALITDPAAAEFLSANDTVVLANHIGELLQSGDLELANQITAFVRRNEDVLAATSPTLFAYFVYHEMVIHRLEDNYERARRSAREILKLVSARDLSADTFANRQPDLIDSLREAASSEIEIVSPKTKKFGRNEVVEVVDTRTGLRYKAKYKKVSGGVAAGYLELTRARNRG